MLKPYIKIAICFLLCGCPTDWESEVKRMSIEDSYNRCNPASLEGSLPEGTICRHAMCSRNLQNYSPRGVCQWEEDLDGMYCLPIDPVTLWCATTESCIEYEEAQGTQAFCQMD